VPTPHLRPPHGWPPTWSSSSDERRALLRGGAALAPITSTTTSRPVGPDPPRIGDAVLYENDLPDQYLRRPGAAGPPSALPKALLEAPLSDVGVIFGGLARTRRERAHRLQPLALQGSARGGVRPSTGSKLGEGSRSTRPRGDRLRRGVPKGRLPWRSPSVPTRLRGRRRPLRKAKPIELSAAVSAATGPRGGRHAPGALDLPGCLHRPPSPGAAIG